jgi:hypothetical protein
MYLKHDGLEAEVNCVFLNFISNVFETGIGKYIHTYSLTIYLDIYLHACTKFVVFFYTFCILYRDNTI